MSLRFCLLEVSPEIHAMSPIRCDALRRLRRRQPHPEARVHSGTEMASGKPAKSLSVFSGCAAFAARNFVVANPTGSLANAPRQRGGVPVLQKKGRTMMPKYDLLGSALAGAMLLSTEPGVAQTNDAGAANSAGARIEAIERQIRALQGELQRVKQEMSAQTQELKRAQDRARASEDEARQAREAAQRAQAAAAQPSAPPAPPPRVATTADGSIQVGGVRVQPSHKVSLGG
jgi:TolA-binding protein